MDEPAQPAQPAAVEAEPEIVDKNKLYVSNLDPEVPSLPALGLQPKD